VPVVRLQSIVDQSAIINPVETVDAVWVGVSYANGQAHLNIENPYICWSKAREMLAVIELPCDVS